MLLLMKEMHIKHLWQSEEEAVHQKSNLKYQLIMILQKLEKISMQKIQTQRMLITLESYSLSRVVFLTLIHQTRTNEI